MPTQKRSKEELDKRQMPCSSSITGDKNYHDLLYAWLQCNSERRTLHSRERWIHKKKCKFTYIEKEMRDSQGEKLMDRRTISKYFKSFIEKGLIQLNENDEYYDLVLLEPGEANLIYYKTLCLLMNVFKRHAIDIYQYLYSRYMANEQQVFYTPISDIKKYIGVAVETTSNNAVVMDPIEIFKRLGLLDYEYIQVEPEKTQIRFNWIKDRLPE